MSLYTTNIILNDSLEKDGEILDAELRKRSFSAANRHNGKAVRRIGKYVNGIDFVKKGNSIQEVIADVLLAARKTGRRFSFTVMKNKN